MGVDNETERRNGDDAQYSWLCIQGTHSPDGFDVMIWVKPHVITFKVFEYLLELIATVYEDPNEYQYNIKSISCSEPRRDGTIDVDATAHERRRALIKIMPEEIETGFKGYRLRPWLDAPVVSKNILKNPYLNPAILARLERAMATSANTSPNQRHR